MYETHLYVIYSAAVEVTLQDVQCIVILGVGRF